MKKMYMAYVMQLPMCIDYCFRDWNCAKKSFNNEHYVTVNKIKYLDLAKRNDSFILSDVFDKLNRGSGREIEFNHRSVSVSDVIGIFEFDVSDDGKCSGVIENDAFYYVDDIGFHRLSKNDLKHKRYTKIH